LPYGTIRIHTKSAGNSRGVNIGIESEVGKGTEFLLFLPLEPPRELKESIMTEKRDDLDKLIKR